MVGQIKLYINNKEVEFSTDPQILYTYQVTDLTNPTAVKNSFSKTITIEGTPNNNDIFGHYWDLERAQGEGDFNSSKKAPFQLFVGSDLYEEGYVKLDSIKRNNGKMDYQCTLFGGLGDFFYNLSVTNNGDQMKLRDLAFTTGNTASEFDFTINKDTVNTAWGVLSGAVNPNASSNQKWQHINFVPAYNGLPKDFDADKVLINVSGTPLPSAATVSGTTYRTKSGNWTIGTLPEDFTEWEMRDLRSYNQRPAIRMKSIINACCNPDNNGGYKVNLDPDFFADDNPYWEKTWLTLGQIQDLEYSNTQQVMTGATLITDTTTGSTSGLMYQDIDFDLGEFPSDLRNINLTAKIQYQSGWKSTSFIWFWNYNGDDAHTGYICLGSLFCQLIAVNGETVVGASEVYNLTTPVRHNGNLYYGNNGRYPESINGNMGGGSKYIPYMGKPINDVLGSFYTDGFRGEGENAARVFSFNINNLGGTVTGLKMVYYWGATADKASKYSPATFFSKTYHDAWIALEVSSEGSVHAGDANSVIQSHSLKAVMGESMGRTGTRVTKDLLLNTESTPCDYLLSYCKMFGLHFTKTLGEKTINILTRKTFYDRSNIVDLEDYIDEGKDITITPLMFSSKWYRLRQEMDESQYAKTYLSAKGVDYGSKVLDTGYEFNSEKKDLLDKNVIKSGIECMEKSKWFTMYADDYSARPWMYMGLTYQLWSTSGEEYTKTPTTTTSRTMYPINEGNGLKYYDVTPKLQFHGDDNSGTDGNNCLVFFSGMKVLTSERTNDIEYILSDDSVYQTSLNEGKPCWLFTKNTVFDGKTICLKLNSIPVFERYLTDANSGNIIKSLDFGSAQELYIPEYTLTDDTNLYNYFWRTYLTDLFDVDTRQLTCYVKINGKPGVDWLNRFYYFRNAIWRVNKISDWNPTTYDTTKVEFVKVQDVRNYTSVSQHVNDYIDINYSPTSLNYTGGTVTVTVDADDEVPWTLTVGGVGMTTQTYNGTGSTTIVSTIGANPDEDAIRRISLNIRRKDNGFQRTFYIMQGFENGPVEYNVIPTYVVLPDSGGTIDVNFQWTIGESSIDDQFRGEFGNMTATTWSVDSTANTAQVSFSANTGNTVLFDIVTYSSTGMSSTMRHMIVNQVPSRFIFDREGSTVRVGFETQMEPVSLWFDNVPGWITVVDNGEGQFDFVAQENSNESPKSAIVTVWYGDTSADFEVYQAGNVVYPTSVDIPGEGGTAEITVLINHWDVVAKPAWITTSSTGNALFLTASSNPAVTDRTGAVVVRNIEDTTTHVISVRQYAGPTNLGVTPSSISFGENADTAVIRITSNNNWRIS